MIVHFEGDHADLHCRNYSLKTRRDSYRSRYILHSDALISARHHTDFLPFLYSFGVVNIGVEIQQAPHSRAEPGCDCH